MKDKYLVKNYIDALLPLGDELQKYFISLQMKKLFKNIPHLESGKKSVVLLNEGRYLLKPDRYIFSEEEVQPAASQLIEILKINLPDRMEDIRKIQNIITADKQQLSTFINLNFTARYNELKKIVDKFNLSEDLFTFFAVYFARPFRQKAASHILSDTSLKNWKNGFCPVCGHWPSFGYFERGKDNKNLWCLHCGTTWIFDKVRCFYCYDSNPANVNTLSKTDEQDFGIQVCKKCRRYLKAASGADHAAKFNFDSTYLGSTILDLIASKEGYVQESSLSIEYIDPDGKEILDYQNRII